jgi:hypothetical protein
MKTQLPLRHIQFNKLTHTSGKRRVVVMTEFLEKMGYRAKAEKKYIYTITERKAPIPDGLTVKEWAERRVEALKAKPQRVFITRIFNAVKGVGRTVCRNSGSFYVIQREKIFAVAYLRVISFNILGKAPAAVI